MGTGFNESILLLISTPLFAVVILAEIITSNIHRHGIYSKMGVFQNIYLMLVNSGIDLLMRIIAFYALTICFENRIGQPLQGWLYWVSLLVLEDFIFYVIHFVDHRVRLFWAVHITHHSSEEFNLTVGFRSSVLEPLYRFVYFLPLAWLGFHPVDIFFMFSLTQIYGILIHTQYVKKLGLLEHFMATPSHHRVHHGQNPEYIDKNMGMFLIIWDKLFGTFTPETAPVKFGVTKPPRHNGPVHLITHEFELMIKDVKNAPDLHSKLMYIFGPPGWSPSEKSIAGNTSIAQVVASQNRNTME